ncbi:MAG TPA: hypothetical protein VG603_14635 [Chitinophagales bacterium]|nr:hypothetical protein [Chitinophagales bacterium]
MKSLVWRCAFFILLAGCRKDETGIGGLRNYSGSSILASSDLQLGGGCVDADGEFIVFSPPTFEMLSSGAGNFIRQPSFKKYNSSGQLVQELMLPAIKWEYNQGSYTWDTINGVIEAWDPSVKVTLAVNRQGDIINSNTTSGLISRYENGNNTTIIQLDRVSGITVDAGDTIFVLICPTYYQDRSLKSPPEIWKLNADGTTTPFYVFPTYYNYPVGNMWGNGSDFFPEEKPDDIFAGSDGFIYVAMCSAGKTFKISKSGQMEELTTDIPAPVSIATSKWGDIFIASAPLIDSIDLKIDKPVEVTEIKVDKTRRVIYSGTSGVKYRGDLTNGNIPGKWVGVGCTLDVSVSSNGDVFLVDPNERKLIRIY